MSEGARRLEAADEAAIEWLVEFNSGDSAADRRSAFAIWLAADSRHAVAWRRLGLAVDRTFGPAPSQSKVAGKVLSQTLAGVDSLARERRRMLRGALALAGVTAATFWGGREAGLIPDVLADLHTSVGERRHFAVGDGSDVLLDAGSSVNLASSAYGWTASLRSGQLIATNNQLHTASLLVESVHGRVQAFGERVMVRLEGARTLAVALGDRAEIIIPAVQARHVLQAGEAAWFDGLQVDVLPGDANTSGAAAWAQGMLEASDMPLVQVIAALRHYRHGLIRVSDSIASLRVTGAYSLDDTDATLTALAETLPIDLIRYACGWIVAITKKTSST